MAIETTSIVKDLALGVPGATRLFESLGIDYCCNGGRPLVQACGEAGIAVETVLETLKHAAAGNGEHTDERNWRSEPLTAIISFILDTHHTFDRQELDRIEPLLAKVSSVYRESHPELVEIQGVFLTLKNDLLNHMAK